jgi:23S rRNA (uracil1939-C5)-methyltransferase
VEESLAEFRLRIPAGSFFQANPPLAERIFEEIAGRCGEAQESILELYAGVGALTLFLARGGRRVTAVEGNPDSIRAARENARLNGFHAIEWIQADIRDAIARWAQNAAAFDVLVLDPPRSGLPRDGARQLASLARRRILYLSCDPATLARDVRDFISLESWRLKEVLPVDFFPQTAGIECLAVLERV